MSERLAITNACILSGGRMQENSAIVIDADGTIASVLSMTDYKAAEHQPSESYDAKGLLVCPGLLDTHIHGIGGNSTDEGTPEAILGMSQMLASFGVTGFLPTLYAGRPDKMIRETRAVVQAMGKETGARILGVNLEGPFLSPLKCGAQDPDSLSRPDPEVFRKMIEAGEGKIRAMSIAPEYDGIEEIARIAAKEDIVLLMGHTNATYGQALSAMDCGVLHATHMFNAMSPMDHKKPGVAGAVLINDRCRCEVIADGVHVHKDLVCHVARTKSEGRMVLITDSLGPTALGEGTFIANGDKVMLGKEGAFVAADKPGQLCGSALTLNRAVRNLVSWGIERPKAVRMATQNPADIYGFKDLGTISEGKSADIAICNEDMEAQLVLIHGRTVFEK